MADDHAANEGVDQFLHFLDMPPLQEHNLGIGNVVGGPDHAIDQHIQELQADQLVNILDMPPLEAHNHAINQQAGNVGGGPVQDHDEIIPAITRCSVCEVARKTCDPNCQYRHTLPLSKLLGYKHTIDTYGKKKLFDWSERIPADKKLKYFDNRIEESVNLQGDLLGGSAKIIHNQAARILELEEQVKQKDAVIRQMQRM